jgi:hypothetical protein
MCVKLGMPFSHLLEDYTEEATALFDMVSRVSISKVVLLTLLDHVSEARDIVMKQCHSTGGCVTVAQMRQRRF